jgi:hypothetical protein
MSSSTKNPTEAFPNSSHAQSANANKQGQDYINSKALLPPKVGHRRQNSYGGSGTSNNPTSALN